LGRKNEARELLKNLSRRSKRSYVSPIDLGNIYIGLGEIDRAVECLEKSLDIKCSRLTYLKVDPAYDTLMSNDKIVDFLKRMRLNCVQIEAE
jgi:hypothetical protein